MACLLLIRITMTIWPRRVNNIPAPLMAAAPTVAAASPLLLRAPMTTRLRLLRRQRRKNENFPTSLTTPRTSWADPQRSAPTPPRGTTPIRPPQRHPCVNNSNSSSSSILAWCRLRWAPAAASRPPPPTPLILCIILPPIHLCILLLRRRCTAPPPPTQPLPRASILPRDSLRRNHPPIPHPPFITDPHQEMPCLPRIIMEQPRARIAIEGQIPRRRKRQRRLLLQPQPLPHPPVLPQLLLPVEALEPRPPPLKPVTRWERHWEACIHRTPIMEWDPPLEEDPSTPLNLPPRQSALPLRRNSNSNNNNNSNCIRGRQTLTPTNNSNSNNSRE